MAFPVAAAIAYGMIAGGGIAGAAAALQRLWSYFSESREEQDLEDEELTPFVRAIVNALSYVHFGKPIDLIPETEQRRLEEQAKTIGPRLKKQLNEAAKERFGKVFSRLSESQKKTLLRELAEEY